MPTKVIERDPEDPFRILTRFGWAREVVTDCRLRAVATFDRGQLEKALTLPDLQKSVAFRIRTRLRQMDRRQADA